ncbi:uncharacterized protein LOC109579498 [Bactrocera dorsalis]|uniref:Uncharacterized protein LOC109579498 n=1 Tax=Bactrocera dorsalis TaxID=27457 RepID=A0A6J0RGT5_BACDO|nr:uncharacterized protein LOC109579498 [Bactrocera dorsalis]
MAAEEVNSISSFATGTSPMMYHSSTSFTIQHSVNMHNMTAGLKVHKRPKQIILPKKMYTEREKLRQMEISEPLPCSALQDLRLQQTRQVKTNRNWEKPKSPKRNTNKAGLRPNQLTLGSTQEAPLAVKVFEECVLPELKANLPQSKSTIDGVLSFELQPSVDGAQRSYASIYEIPPAAQTWRRSDCFKGRSKEGLLNEIMKEINMRSASATYILTTPDNCKPMK